MLRMPGPATMPQGCICKLLRMPVWTCLLPCSSAPIQSVILLWTCRPLHNSQPAGYWHV